MKRLLTGLTAAAVLLTGLAAPAAAGPPPPVKVGDCLVGESVNAACTGTDIAGLANHKGITAVQLEVVPASLKVLASLPKLDNLQLGKQFETGKIPSGPLADLAGTSIEYLELHQPAQDLTPLAAMPKLKHLGAHGTDYAHGGASLARSTSLEGLGVTVGPGADPRPLLASTSLQRIGLTYRGPNLKVKVGETFTVPTFTGLDGKPFAFTHPADAPNFKPVGVNTYKATAPDIFLYMDSAHDLTVTSAGRTIGWSVEALMDSSLVTTTDVLKASKGYISPTAKTVTTGQSITFVPQEFNYPNAWGSYTCEWLRNGKPTGAKDCSRYTLRLIDSNATLSVRVTAHPRAGYKSLLSAGSTTFTAKYTVLGVFKHRAKISGTTRVGSTLKATTTNAPKGTALAHQWLREGKAIKGATRASYTLVAADRGKRLSVKVTAKKPGFVSSATTPGKTAKVSKGILTLKKHPTVSGTKKVGKTLTANPGTWSVKPDSHRYQWYRSGAAINKAIKAKYKFTTRDRGKVIYVKVTAQKKGYTSKSANSKVR